MCGITGIIGQNFDHRHLDTMMQRIAHRGPDAQGKWTNGAVSFGHLRLSIIDLSDRATQPMHCTMSGNIVIFNGEIYNYLELKAELSEHYLFRTDSDTEVLLAAYLCWGIDFLKRLRGMFGFALYDAGRQAVLLARDRFGIKPLYYRQTGGAVLFSSEIKGLLALPGLYHSVHLNKVFGFLAYRHLDTDEETFFREVKQLPQASYVWATENGQMTRPVEYWQVPTPGERPFEMKDREIFRDRLTESVRLHLRSDVPVASFLSGGLDSSSIACLALQLLGKDYGLQTYSSVLEEKTEENTLIAVMQAHLEGAVHHGVTFDGSNFLKALPRITYHHDEPLADASMYVHWELCKLASQHGVKVMLSGNGGDEVLGGYASYIYALLGRFLQNGNLAALIRYALTFSQNRSESFAWLLLRSAQEAMPYSVRERVKKAQSAPARRLMAGFLPADEYIFYPHRNKDPYTANFFNNLRSWTVPPFLHYEDRNSMAFGVEIRVPMLDHDFFEFVTSFRPEDLLRGRSKQVLRQSLHGIVPAEVLGQKQKFGFAAPLERYIGYDIEATHRFFTEQVRSVPFFNQTQATLLAKEVLVERNPTRFQYFWRTLSVAIWYNAFFGNLLATTENIDLSKFVLALP